MKETYNAAKVGLLVLVTLVASIAIYRFVDEGTSGDEGYHVYAIFDDVQGLVEKSRVVIAGIPVGIIEKIRLDGARARVDIKIDQGVKLFKDEYTKAGLQGDLGTSQQTHQPVAHDQRTAGTRAADALGVHGGIGLAGHERRDSRRAVLLARRRSPGARTTHDP